MKPNPKPPDPSISLVASRLATRTRGMSGATLAFLCQSAARECVREAVATSGRSERHGAGPPTDICISAAHLDSALASALHGA